MRDSLAPASRAMSKNWLRWSKAITHNSFQAGRAAVVRCKWANCWSASTLGLRLPPNQCASSPGVGIAAEHAWRDTTIAPQALATRVESAHPLPCRRLAISPDKNASPAPSTLSTSTRSPGKVGASLMSAGMAPSITQQPKAPRLTTKVALLTARTAFRLARMSLATPPAMKNSSSVPTSKSNSGRTS